MDLDQVLLVLAHLQAPLLTDECRMDRVRADLLQVLGGAMPSGLSEEASSTVRAWLKGQRDAHSVLYEQTLHRLIVRAPGGQLRMTRRPQSHRATGAYYTGGAVVRYMSRQARNYLPGAVSVIDPACGAGALLEGVEREYGAGCLRLVGIDSDPLALELCRRQLPEAELHMLDALLDPLGGSYDLCLGNPPYISSGLRGSAPQDAAKATRLRERFPATAQYKLNTYPLFVERGLELLRTEGVLGYILPDSFLTGRYFKGLRQLLLNQTLLELTLIQGEFWENGRVGQSVILFVRKGAAPVGHKVAIKVCADVRALDDAPAFTVSLTDLVWSSSQRFRLIADPAIQVTVTAMEAAGVAPLGSLVRSYSGLIGRKGQVSLLRSTNPGLSGPWAPLLRSGGEIDRYRLAWAGEEVCLQPDLIKSGGHRAHYEGPKLLLRQTADTLRAVYDEQGYYCLNNIHLLVARRSDLDLRVMLGVINSSAVGVYYRAVAMEQGRLYAQVDLDLLESLPFPAIPPAEHGRLRALVQQRQNAASAEAASLEGQIDQVVNRLYGLPDRSRWR